MEAFDQIFTEILTVADVLADGVVKQFPEKFDGSEAMTATLDDSGVGEGGLYQWDDPNFDKSRDMMHTPGTSQYLGPSPPDKIAGGIPPQFAQEAVERHGALVDLVADRPVAVGRTDPFGCGIVW